MEPTFTHERLFLTRTRQPRRSFKPEKPRPLTTAQLQRLNRSATISREGDLMLVTYKTSRNGVKQDTTLTARGNCRTVSGGFFSS